MPAHYDINGNLIWLRLEGKYTADDLREEILRLVDDPERPVEPQFLMDVTGSTSLADRTADEVRTMAAFFGSHAELLGGRMAILVEGELAHGLMRMGAAHTEANNLIARVFHEEAEALNWLENSDSIEP